MSEEIYEKIRQAIKDFDGDTVKAAAQESLDKGIDPLQTIDVLTDTIREIGNMFERMEIFVPELMMAAEAMKEGIAVLEPEVLKKGGRERSGTIVIGAVEGDIHDIGKAIVSTMLTGSGFNVIDLGTDISASAFAAAAKEHNADIVAASSLMTTTMVMQEELVKHFTEIGLKDKVKIIVGGAVVTQKYADDIGADAYGANAIEAVDVAKKLVGK
ncbi:MAG: cobalamin-dependent protein [Candidatus Bathyarchaeota archaeon]|nr:MAG: cobalamin-dependent protein [Candidatus Bathyarchaeota archaeon]